MFIRLFRNCASQIEAEGVTDDEPRKSGPGLIQHVSHAASPDTVSATELQKEIIKEEGEEAAGAVVAAWVGSAMIFGTLIGYFLGAEKSEEFFAGYLLEQSLSIDNLFVFILLFKYFQVGGGGSCSSWLNFEALR